ncbi:phosphoenolpyruvate carboxylase [Candidatus Peregrinibacteria bacterium CG11_big_fil_rev_8_21_14_0_20_46_8]|nr:MAG: phosphoenolpyruvate carboxylase [Candidatus Peregrinibacteria bacterium CG11_big_fil_rev_8_21_14_0_20_46_8]
MKRRIPTVMATQHPDNAGIVPWLGKAFITTQDEIEECWRTFFELGCDEYMWDWEGKFADEAVFEKLYQRYLKDFKKKQLGRDIFMTLRIPNIWEETSFKLARAYMSMLTADDFAKSLKMHAPPFFEAILPMTTAAKQLIHVQTTFQKIAALKNEMFATRGKSLSHLEMIPLFESVEHLTTCDKILHEYFALHKKTFGNTPAYLRPFIARSDPALNAGLVPAVLACKIAIHKMYDFAAKKKIPVYPIIGTGGLPFRGGANPENIEHTCEEYKGIRTLTIQSAFRYDYAPAKVKRAIEHLKKTLPKQEPDSISAHDEKDLLESIAVDFIKPYRTTIEACAEFINSIAAEIPSRRERVLHIGLFGYSRGIGKTQLPRAIKFTAAWYSLGIPPEIIGTGRGLAAAAKRGKLKTIEKYFPTMRNELQHACKYLNRENLQFLARKHPELQEIEKDIMHIETILEIELGPKKPHHIIHRNLTSTIVMKRSIKEDFSAEIVEAARARKSLG